MPYEMSLKNNSMKIQRKRMDTKIMVVILKNSTFGLNLKL